MFSGNSRSRGWQVSLGFRIQCDHDLTLVRVVRNEFLVVCVQLILVVGFRLAGQLSELGDVRFLLKRALAMFELPSGYRNILLSCLKTEG